MKKLIKKEKLTEIVKEPRKGKGHPGIDMNIPNIHNNPKPKK